MSNSKPQKIVFSRKDKFPLFVESVKAGFPSPADDFIDKKMSLDEFLIKHPAATYFVRVEGDSMIGAGIFPGDILIIDKSLQPKNKSIVIASLNGEFTVKRFEKRNEQIYLVPANSNYKEIKITAEMDLEIWGVVSFVIHKV